MAKYDSSLHFQEASLGISYSDYLFAYRKEIERILKLSKGSSTTLFKHGLDALLSRNIVTKAEAANLNGCITATMKARLGKADRIKTLIYLQNMSAKSLIGGGTNSYYLNFINLCIGLVREVEGKKFPSRTSTTAVARVIGTLPGGSGAAIMAGAIVGGVIGFDVGGPLGGLIGGLIGGLVGASNDIDVVVPDPQGGGTPT